MSKNIKMLPKHTHINTTRERPRERERNTHRKTYTHWKSLKILSSFHFEYFLILFLLEIFWQKVMFTGLRFNSARSLSLVVYIFVSFFASISVFQPCLSTMDLFSAWQYMVRGLIPAATGPGDKLATCFGKRKGPTPETLVRRPLHQQ